MLWSVGFSYFYRDPTPLRFLDPQHTRTIFKNVGQFASQHEYQFQLCLFSKTYYVFHVVQRDWSFLSTKKRIRKYLLVPMVEYPKRKNTRFKKKTQVGLAILLSKQRWPRSVLMLPKSQNVQFFFFHVCFICLGLSFHYEHEIKLKSSKSFCSS